MWPQEFAALQQEARARQEDMAQLEVCVGERFPPPLSPASALAASALEV